MGREGESSDLALAEEEGLERCEDDDARSGGSSASGTAETGEEGISSEEGKVGRNVPMDVLLGVGGESDLEDGGDSCVKRFFV